jgi:hypothetical protein
MKCERAIAALGHGTVLSRFVARRHAERCQACAAETARLARIANALAVVEPLTPAQRALWTAVSTDPRPDAARTKWPWHVRLASTAAVLSVAALLAFSGVRCSVFKGPIDKAHPPTVITEKLGGHASPELIRELDALTTDFRALSQELAQLSRRAELLDERRDAEALTRRYVAMNTR